MSTLLAILLAWLLVRAVRPLLVLVAEAALVGAARAALAALGVRRLPEGVDPVAALALYARPRRGPREEAEEPGMHPRPRLRLVSSR